MRTILSALGLLAGIAGSALATPSTEYWTPCVIDFQGFKVVHLTYDNYTTLGRKGADRGAFPNDLGLTVGILPFAWIQAEIGCDWLEPSADPLLFNAKLGTPEGALFRGSPALEAGIFNVGVKRGVTNLNVTDLITGISLPGGFGRIHLGGYAGNASLLVDPDGKKDNIGFMAAYDLGLFPAGPEGASWNRVILALDYMSGKNVLGGGGAGVYWFFSRDVSILLGPVWFNNHALNGDWKWTTQLDANF